MKGQYHIKDYLSYSQFATFMQSPEAYRKIYIFGYKFSNKYTDFGSKIHKALETRKAADRDEKIALDLISKVKAREVEITTKIGGVPLFGKIDGVKEGQQMLAEKKDYEIIEYKTSKNGWTQKMVDTSDQLTFYAMMFAASKKIPIEDILIRLRALRTFEDIDGTLHLTGEKQSFKTARTQADVDKLVPKIQKAWRGIGEMLNEDLNGKPKVENK